MSFSSFETFFKSLNPFPVLGKHISKESYIPLDLSIHNTELQTVDVSSSSDLETYIWQYIKTQNARVAYGGYLEQRGIYQRSDYFNASQTEQNQQEERNIHLGIDLWIKAGSPIYAPLRGEIHSFKNNTNYGDYGPTIILKHHIEGKTFYTLYGHLSLDSIEDLKVGVEVKQGEQIATLGKAEVNGDYPPHLHFQIIKDIQNNAGDYPGVSSAKDLEFYKENCPDANWLLRL
ncbi:MAG: peptidase M23 [Flavobacteriaceae bacterium]|nr:peptidase M23 [Flavobacteriaceae bacterium]